MTPDLIDRVAERLLQARRDRRQIVPPTENEPPDRAVAYAIQDVVGAGLGAVGGWKVGADNPAAEPVAAPLPASAIVASGARFNAADFTTLGIEAELGFRLASDLPSRKRDYSREEVAAAIESVRPTIEIVDSRWIGWPRVDRAWQIADHQSNGALVHGQGRSDWDAIDFSIQPVKLTMNDRLIAEALGGNAAGDLLRLLTWLATHAARRCGGLKAGDIVTTGSCTGLSFATPDSTVRASFPGIGDVEVYLAAA